MRYQGHIFGAGLDLLPVKSDGGWTSSVSYQHAFYEKILPGANDLTLNELDEDRYQGEIAWTSATTRNHSWGIKANAEFRDRKGTEILYGDAVNSIYPQIATAQQFGSERLWSNLSAFYEQEQTKVWRWSLQPAVGYHYRKDTYKSPSKKGGIQSVRYFFSFHFYLEMETGYALCAYLGSTSGKIRCNPGYRTSDTPLCNDHPATEFRYAKFWKYQL